MKDDTKKALRFRLRQRSKRPGLISFSLFFCLYIPVRRRYNFPRVERNNRRKEEKKRSLVQKTKQQYAHKTDGERHNNKLAMLCPFVYLWRISFSGKQKEKKKKYRRAREPARLSTGG
jgi:hypothetical protein